MKKSALLLVVMLVVTMCFCLAACDEDSNVLVQHVCTFGEWTVTEPTCEADGARTRKCERCGAEETVVLQKSGHTEVIDAAKTATCTETGLTEGKHCSVCNKVLVVQKEIAKLGHSYGEWIIVSELTCTTDGEKKRVCQTCGYEDKQIEKAVGHKISEEWTIDKEATPDSDGQKSRHCKNCDYITDIIVIRMHTHSFADDFTCHDRECTVENCGYIEPATTDHTYGSWLEEPAATCIDKGTKKRSCENCGFTEEEDINALGHDFSEEWTIDVAATCEHVGSKSHHCSRCSEKSDVTEIEKADHAYSEWTMRNAATCTADRVEIRTCSVCGKAEKRIIENSALGHNFSEEWTIDVAATCRYAGSKSHHCRRCSAKSDVTEIEKVEHTYSSWRIYSAETCTKNRVVIKICSVCGKEETQEVENTALGHDKVTHAAKAATCTATGWTEYETCTRCDYTTFTVIPATGHNYDSADICKICGQEKETDASQFIFEYDDEMNVYSVIGYKGTDKKVVIPAKYDDGTNGEKAVASIGYRAFYECSGLTSVTIPDSVTGIDSCAFSYCIGLTSITIPASVRNIGREAFLNCSKLISVTIPDNVTEIGSQAFANCVGLVSVTIGSRVFRLATNAFSNCYRLVEIYNKSSLLLQGDDEYSEDYDVAHYAENIYTSEGGSKLSISSDGFVIYTDGNRKSLIEYIGNETQITIPEGITEIHNFAFFERAKLTSVAIFDSVTKIGEYAFYKCSGLTSIVIPDEVTDIGLSAFDKCSGLTSVILGNGVINIGSSAFFQCSKLTNVVIGNSVESIGDYAFLGCSGLTSVTIPDSVTSIGSYAFYGCNGLTSVVIGKGVTSIDYMAFVAEGLNAVYYKGSSEEWNDVSFGSSKGSKTGLEEKAIYFYSETQPTTTGNYWHYVDGEIVVWIVHIFGEWAEKTAATCTTDRVEYRVCSECGEEETRIIENTATGHNYNADGVCNNCGKAKSTETDASYFTFEYDSELDEYAVAKYNGSDTDVVIPSMYNDGTNGEKAVTSIGKDAFRECLGLTSVIIGSNVISIGESAFYKCSGLKSITIPDSITSIGNYAFNGCSGLTSLNIPDSVSKIGGYAFSNCSSLQYNIYDNAKYLGNSNNPYVVLIKATDTSIASCEINGSTKFIHNSAFSKCSGITSITIPDSITSIGAGAFTDCIELTTVNWNATVCTIVGDAFVEPVFGLGSCTKLSSVNIGNNVTIIPPMAFYGCIGLKSITIPDSVTSIGLGAFTYCVELTSIIIPDSVTSIGDCAFMYCGLTSVTIGSGVTSIGGFTFEGCSMLARIEVSESNTVYSSKDGILYDKEQTKFVHIPKNVQGSITIPDSVTSIGEEAFSECIGLTSVTIGSGVTSIGNSAFYDCYKLVEVYNKSSLNIQKGSKDNGYVGYYAKDVYTSEYTSKIPTDNDGFIIYNDGYFKSLMGYTGSKAEITIPQGITEIYQYAFYGCSWLTSITIPDSVTSIGEYAFYNCSGLTSITISENVMYIGQRAFSFCSGLNSITVEAGNEFYYSKNNCIISVRNKELILGCQSSEIPNDGSVTSIGDGAFYGCIGLTSITIPDSVTSIGEYVFYNCSGLKSVTIGSGVTSISKRVFSGCSGLTSVTIGSGVTSIGGWAFFSCSKLTNIFYTGDIAGWCGISGLNEIMSSSCTLYIGGNKVEGDVVIPNSVTSIGRNAFEGCSEITSITIPDSVTSIGNSAFKYCSGFTSITIPDSVTNIGDYAFYYCSGLTSITYHGTMEEWKAIEKRENIFEYSSVSVIHCSDGDIEI